MKPRSKRYFARRWSRKYGETLFTKLIPIFEAMDAYMKLTAPRPKYPPGTTHPGGTAIVGEVGPELLIMRDGSRVITTSRIFPRIELPAGTMVFPESVIKEGVYDVKITNFMTPEAEMTVKKVDNDRPE
jgi:hypothetical protein